MKKTLGAFGTRLRYSDCFRSKSRIGESELRPLVIPSVAVDLDLKLTTVAKRRNMRERFGGPHSGGERPPTLQAYEPHAEHFAPRLPRLSRGHGRLAMSSSRFSPCVVALEPPLRSGGTAATRAGLVRRACGNRATAREG